MQVRQALNRLDLDDEAASDQKVNPECGSICCPIKVDVDRHLPVNDNSAALERAGQNRLVDAFEQARTEFAMDAYAFIDNNTAQIIDLDFFPPFSAPPRLCERPRSLSPKPRCPPSSLRCPPSHRSRCG